MSGNGKDTQSTSQSTEDEEQEDIVPKCWVCGQTIFPDKDNADLDQATQIALIVVNAFLLSHFGDLIKLQELDRLYTKEGHLKGWMATLMAIVPHQDVQHRLLGRAETFHDVGKIMFGFDYQVVPERSSSKKEIVANLKKARKIKAKTTKDGIRRAASRQRARMKGGVMRNE